MTSVCKLGFGIFFLDWWERNDLQSACVDHKRSVATVSCRTRLNTRRVSWDEILEARIFPQILSATRELLTRPPLQYRSVNYHFGEGMDFVLFHQRNDGLIFFL